MRAKLRLRRRGDRGAVLIIVAVFSIVAVIMLAIVVDLGGLRQEEKEVTLSTDAAALAAASLVDWSDSDLVLPLVERDCSAIAVDPDARNATTEASFATVQDAVTNYLTRNGGSSGVLCKVVRTGTKQGYVLVSADETVDYQVANAFGQTGGSVGGVSVAAVRSDPGGGLRPIGICSAMTTLEHSDYPELSLEDLADGAAGGYALDGSGYVTEGGDRTTFVARFPIDHVKGGSCGSDGGGSGNFAQVNFGPQNKTSCSESGHFCKDIEDGYYDPVTDPTYGETGSNWDNTATEDSLEKLRDEVGQFWSPVYVAATKSGSNTLLDMDPGGFYVQLELVDFCTSGSCRYAEPDADPSTASGYFDFRVSRLVPYIATGPDPTDDALQDPPYLCSTTADATDIATNCLGAAGPATPPPPPPPPSACTFGSATVSPEAKKHSTKSELQREVEFRVSVSDATACAGLTMTITRSGFADNPVDSCCTISGSHASGTEGKSSPANYWTSTGTYTLVVTAGAETATYDFTVA